MLKPRRKYVYISSPVTFLEYLPTGAIGSATEYDESRLHPFGITMSDLAPDHTDRPAHWVYLCRFTIPLDELSEEVVLKAALKELDNQSEVVKREATERLEELKQQKESLRALTHQPTIMDSEVSIG